MGASVGNSTIHSMAMSGAKNNDEILKLILKDVSVNDWLIDS